MKQIIKFWLIVIPGITAILLLFGWLETEANTNDPPHPKTPQLESVKLNTTNHATGGLMQITNNVTTILSVDPQYRVMVYGKLVGTINTNTSTFLPVPVMPDFNTGVQIGAQLARRKPDVGDLRMLTIMAAQEWEKVKGGRP